MAGICCGPWIPPPLHPRISPPIHGLRWCFAAASPGHNKDHVSPFLRIAVGGATELLRLFSSNKGGLDTLSHKQGDEIIISDMDDVLRILRSDYEKSYFVTGMFTSAIYAEDCLFEDPTIRFRGKDLYSRNLKLLVPFIDCPSIKLETIKKGTDFVFATWKLRAYLKLPWRPLISIDGNTIYDLDEGFQIVRHAESWGISALEAIGQIFVPSSHFPGAH